MAKMAKSLINITYFNKNKKKMSNYDPMVEHPKHYTSHPSGIECIDIIRYYDLPIGNAMKYLWRHGLKHEDGMDDKAKAIQDLKKAVWYIEDEIKMLEKSAG